MIASQNYDQQSPIGGLFKVLFLVCIVIAAIYGWLYVANTDSTVAQATIHAIEKHGAVASDIVDFCKQNPEATRYRETDGRKAVICFIPDLGWSVAIFERTDEDVTSFPKSKLSRIEQVLKYLENSGYKLTEPPAIQ